MAAAAWGFAIALTPRACQWQTEQQALLGLPQTTTSWPIVALASVVLLVVMVVIGRLIRGLGRAVARGIEWLVVALLLTPKAREFYSRDSTISE